MLPRGGISEVKAGLGPQDPCRHGNEQGSQAAYNQRCFGAWLPALREGQAVPPPAAPSTAPAQSTSGPTDQPAARKDDPVWIERHAELLEKARKGGIDLYFLGDS